MRASMPADAWRPMIATMQATAPTRPIIANDHARSTKENKIARARPIAAVIIILRRTIDLAPTVDLALTRGRPTIAGRNTTLGTRLGSGPALSRWCRAALDRCDTTLDGCDTTLNGRDTALDGCLGCNPSFLARDGAGSLFSLRRDLCRRDLCRRGWPLDTRRCLPTGFLNAPLLALLGRGYGRRRFTLHLRRRLRWRGAIVAPARLAAPFAPLSAALGSALFGLRHLQASCLSGEATH
jgi:hypothetical protein